MNESISTDQVDRLLRQLGEAFLLDLLDHCNQAESDLLLLEKKFDPVVFNRLFGLVHSIKGSGGTHGFSFITSIGHQFESKLIDWQRAPTEEGLPVLLGFVDLLRQAARLLFKDQDLTPLEQSLEKLRLGSGQIAKRILLVESSRIMRQLCQQVLANLSVQVDTFDDGLKALNQLLHSHYSCLIIGRQLNSLNGAAVVAALRESDSSNRNIPVLMISTDQRQLPEHLNILKLLPRTPELSDVLHIEMDRLIKKRTNKEDGKLA